MLKKIVFFIMMLTQIFSCTLTFYGFTMEGRTIRNCISATGNYLCMDVPVGDKQLCIFVITGLGPRHSFL